MNITHLLAAGLVAALAAGASAQDDAQQKLIEQRDKKLAADFLKNADWITSYDEALAAAKETGKPVFAYFTRSYSP